MDEDKAMVLLLPVFLIWKGFCFLCRQLLWWLAITAAVVFILRSQGINLRFETPVQLTPADVYTDPVVDDKGNPK